MILGTSFKCLASKLLLILTWCDIVVQVICYSCVDAGSFSGGISITSAVGGGDSSSSPVSSLLNGGHYIGGTGSVLLLMTFLCINFQDVNSMSVPRQQLNKLPGFSKQGSAKKRPSKQDGKKKKTKKKKNKSKSAHKAKSTESPETNDGEYGKSKLISLPGSPTPSPSSTNINNWNGVNPPVLPAPHQNILYGKDSGPSPSIRDNKRKSDRLGQNNVVSSGSALAAASAVASGSSLMGSLFMNENEEEALRRKILAKIDDLDPLMCLPKVLCGYSNRRRHKNYSNFPIRPTTTTTPRPILAESLIDEYVKLLKIIRPGVSGEEEQEQEKEQNDDTKKNGKKKKNKKKRPLKKKKKKKVEESEEEEEGEESEESDESNKSRKAITKPKSKYKKSKKSSFDSSPDEDEEEEVDDDDDNGEEEEGDEEYDDDGEEGLIDFDDDHVKHVKKRARMEKLMDTSGQYSDENWWTDLDDNNLKLPLSYEPPSKPTTSTLPNGGGWLSSMMNMVSPLISWGLGGSKDDGDDFKDDPFFLESRSLKGGVSGGGESRSLKSNGTLPTISSSRRGKTMDLEKLFGILDTDKVDYTKEKDPWTNKFRVAVELGRRISSPSQCDFIYNGCPLSYEEILAIINEPLKQATTTTTTTTPAPTTKNMSFTHHYITLPPPIIMQLPLQHQYHQYHNPYLLPQQHQQSPYHQPVQHQQQQQHQQMHYHHPVHHQQPQYHHQQLQNQHNIQHQQHQQHEQPQMEQNYNQNQQFQQPKPTSFNDLYAQVLKKPQKATIKQSMPSGEEFHINLLYDSMRKTGLAEKQVQTTTTRTTTAEASVEEDDDNNSSLSSGSSSAGNDDPLSYKVLKYHNNNFLQRQPLYSIRRRNDEKTKPIIMKDVVPVSTTGTGGSNSNSNSAEESMELNPLTPANSIATDNMMRQQVRPSAVPFTKVEGKYKYKQLLKGTKAPPRRQSSKEKFKQQQRNRKGNEDRSKNPRRKTKKKTKTPSYYESNSITRFSNHSKKRKAERFKNHHHSFQPKRKHKTHLHKQSSVRIGVKNRRKIPASNARRPDYGHRFPTSYGGHYRKPKPSTPSYLPNSFFNYLFGKPYI